MAGLTQLDTENADRNLTSEVTVLTDIPHSSKAIWCQAVVFLGDGIKNLDGTGGDFEMRISVGGNDINGGVETKTCGGAVRSVLYSAPFLVPANDQVIVKVKSPNVADTDVDTTAYLYDMTADSVDLNADQSAVTIGTTNYVTYGVTVDTNNDKLDYTLNSSILPIDANLTEILSTSLSGTYLAQNFDTFFGNSNSTTSEIVDNVGSGGWDTTEKNQIRHRIGIDGTTATPTSNTPNLTVDLNASQTGVTIGTVNTVTNGVTVDTNNDKSGYYLYSGEYTNILDEIMNADATTYTTADTFGRRLGPDINAIRSDCNSLDNTKIPDTLSLANINAEVVDVVSTDTRIDGHSLEDAIMYCMAVLCGTIADAGAGTETFKDPSGTDTRVTVTVDSSGNRSAVVLSNA